MHHLYTDGGARGNPGPAGIGAILFDEKLELIDFEGAYIGEATNNVAEYKALIVGLEMAKANNVTDLTCYLDSELVVKQLNGVYKVKNPSMAELFKEVKQEIQSLENVEFLHVPRESNRFADKMVNTVLDARK